MLEVGPAPLRRTRQHRDQGIGEIRGGRKLDQHLQQRATGLRGGVEQAVDVYQGLAVLAPGQQVVGQPGPCRQIARAQGDGFGVQLPGLVDVAGRGPGLGQDAPSAAIQGRGLGQGLGGVGGGVQLAGRGLALGAVGQCVRVGGQ